MEVADDGNLVVLDSRFGRVIEFDRAGAWLSSFDLPTGNGPGEMYRPSDISVDDNVVYILSLESRKISEYTRDGVFLLDRRLRHPATSIVASDGFLYSTALWLAGDTVLFRENLSTGKLVGLRARPAGWEDVARIGNFEKIALTPSGNLLYSYPTPYRLLELSSAGLEVREARGMPPFTLPARATRIPQGAVIYSARESTRGLVALDDGRVVNVVERDGQVLVDIFDADLSFLTRIDSTAIGAAFSNIVTAGSADEVYVAINSVNPSIIQYRLEPNR